MIYKILNKINGKKYVGMTSRSIEKRFYEHCNARHRFISDIIKKYGVENFEISKITETNKYSKALFIEKENIIKENALFPYGYNLACNGNEVAYIQSKVSGKQNELF